jgi:hypothetical protein
MNGRHHRISSWAAGALLALELAAGCSSGGHSQPSPDTLTSSKPTPSAGSDAAVEPSHEEPTSSTPQELDAGPIQDQFIFDASTTPTSEYVRGWDAAAGEAERGFADEDAGPDAN